MSARVSFVIVSHSAYLAVGVCELAAQMAPDVRFEAAGGTDEVASAPPTTAWRRPSRLPSQPWTGRAAALSSSPTSVRPR